MNDMNRHKTDDSIANTEKAEHAKPRPIEQPKGEIGGTAGQEPTIFGDWQHAGRCSDF